MKTHEKINAERMAQELTIFELAFRASIPEYRMSRILTGDRNLKEGELSRIALALGKTEEDLIGEDGLVLAEPGKPLAIRIDDEWIPVSAALPEEKESAWAKFASTPKWNDRMWITASDYYNVTVVDAEGNRKTKIARLKDGKWTCPERVIAWKPEIMPYMGDE